MPADGGQTHGPDARVRSETALQRALRAAASEAWAEPVARAHAFFALWGKLAGIDPVSPAAICAYCMADATPNPALLDIADVVGQLDWPSPRMLNAVHRSVVEVVELMTLVLCERRIEAAGFDPAGMEESGLLVVPMADRLAASLVAAAWLKCRVKMSVDAKGRPLVLNLLTDLPPVEFGWRDVQQAHSAELLAYLNHSRGGGTAFFSSRKQELETVQRRGLQDEADISDMLAAARRRRDFADPVFGLTQNEHPQVDVGTRVWLRDQYGLESFKWSRPDEGDVDEKFRKLQGNLLQHIEDIIQRVYAGAVPMTSSPDKEVGMSERSSIFISYSHKDKDEWLGRFQDKLATLARQEGIDIWDDTRIRPGDDWAAEIDKALQGCKVALLLISDGFLTSKYITEKEFPDLLARHRAGGMRVYPILVKDCTWEGDPDLSRLQIKMAGGTQPLEAYVADPAKLNAEMTRIAREVRDFIQGK